VRKGFLVALLLFILLLALGCDNYDSGDCEENLGDDENDDATGTLPIAEVVVESAPETNPLARKIVVTTDKSCSLSGKVTAVGESGYGPSVPSKSEEGTTHEFWFYGLLEDLEFTYAFSLAEKSGEEIARGTFRTPELGIGNPVFQELRYAEDSDCTDWYMVYEQAKQLGVNLNLILDRKGRTRFYHVTSAGNFTQVMPGGDLVSTKLDRLVAISKQGVETDLIVVDLAGDFIKSTHHKFFLESVDANFAVVIFDHFGPGVECDLITPTNNAVGDGVVEIDGSGNEIWRWDAFDHQDQIPAEAMDPDFCVGHQFGPDTYDWTHANAVEPVPNENAYLISMRNVSRLVKVDRGSGTVIWQMGDGLDFEWLGSEPVSDRWFYRQHEPVWLSSNRLLVYDNSYHGSSFSRTLELDFDESEMTVENVWEYRLPNHHTGGNAQRHENGNTLIGGGSNKHLVELPPGGEAGDELFFAAFENGILRAEYYPAMWIYDEK
jgi:Arylsulfotransferase (ASST)